MRLLCIGDVHLNDTPPSSCTDRYMEDIWSLLEQIRVMSETNHMPTIFAGDLFHTKAPSRNSHELVIKAMRYFQRFGSPPFVVLGNHDMRYDRIDTVQESQPIGELLASGAIYELSNLPSSQVVAGDFRIVGFPWQPVWDWELIKIMLERIAEYKPTLVVAHAPLSLPGENPPWEHTPVEAWVDILQCDIFYGHIHDDKGTHTIGEFEVCNHGALSRGALTENDLTRAPCATLYDTTLRPKFRRLDLQYLPASEIFATDKVEARLERLASADEFMESVEKTVLTKITPQKIMAEAKSAGVSQSALNIIERLVGA